MNEEAEERFRAIFEQPAVGMAHIGLNGRFLLINRRLCDIVGYVHGKLMGMTFQDITHPEDLDAGLADEQRLLAGEIEHYATQKRYTRKNGSLVCVKQTVALARNRQGQPDYFVCVIEDISERKLIEEQFRTLADSIPQLCWMADPEGYLVWYNRRWLEYTGKTLEQMWGRKWVPVLDAEVQPGVLERWLESVSSGQPFDMVIPIQGKDGGFRPFLTRVEPVKDARGRVVQWCGTNTDISALNRTEDPPG